jgi:antitoxin VapB
MHETKTAKLFKNGASQAVRLPADCRFEGTEVYVHRDPVTGDVTLSSKPGLHAWERLFAELHALDVPAAFMADRPMNTPAQERDLFEDAA